MAITSARRCRISPVPCHLASSIRASRRLFAAANVASRAAISRRPPSSTSCRTTTRSAIARWATGSKAMRMRARSKRRSRCCCWRRPFPCCSWARNGARRRPSRSSAISAATSPMPSARAAAPSTPGPMQSLATRCRTHSIHRRVIPPCSTGKSATRRQHGSG